MNKKKKFVSVGQQMHEDAVSGIVYLIGGFFFSCRGIEKHLILAICFEIAFLAYGIFNDIRDRNCEEERFDEMAKENRYKASNWVLIDFKIVSVIILFVYSIHNVLKYCFSVEIQWGKYFAMNPLSFVLLMLGFEYLMTGFHFERLERE